MGFAGARPSAPNATDENRAGNRRVKLKRTERDG